MDLRPSLQIQTVIKALVDVVLPAVDPANKLAQEQAHLAVGMLQLLLQRQPLTYRYERDELARFLALADSLQTKLHGLPAAAPALQALRDCATGGADVLERARAEPGELEAANFGLRAAIGALVSAAYAAAPFSDLKPVSDTLTAHAKEQLLRERSWLLAQGWEAAPQDVPPIERLIGETPAA